MVNKENISVDVLPISPDYVETWKDIHIIDGSGKNLYIDTVAERVNTLNPKSANWHRMP